MNMHRQIYTLAFIRALRMFMIIMPVIVLYWQSYGLQLRDIFILQVIFSVAVIAFEIPSGYFADRFGHKISMLLGSIFSTIGFFVLWSTPGYWGFILSELTLALSAGFMSGARDALLYDTLETNGEEGTYTKWQGKLMGLGHLSEAIAAVAAGIIASFYSIPTVLLVQWVVALFTIPLALSLKEVYHRQPEAAPALLKILRGSVRENARLQSLHLFSGALAASTLTLVWFVQPHWKELGINVLYFGYLWAFLNLTVGLGSAIAHRLEARLRFRTLFGVIAVAPLVLYTILGLGANSIWILAIVPFFWLLRGVSAPIIQDYVQREADANARATVLSINALSSRLLFSIFSPFLGWIGDIWDLQTAFLASGMAFGILTLLGFTFWYRTLQK